MSNKKHIMTSEPTQVRFTGDWSADSKLSSIQNGYWEDSFFSLFNPPSETGKTLKRTALICRGYYVRFKICDHFIKRVLSSISCSPLQVVSLGCGMDTSFFRLESDSQFSSFFCKFFELDFPSIIHRKSTIIKSNENLRLLAQDKLVLVEADLRKIGSLYQTLENAGFDFDKPTLFYSECVVNYLKPSESEAILHWITENVKENVWLAYEQCYPADSFGKIMVSHFQRNGCPIQSIEHNGDMEKQEAQLRNAKFKYATVRNVWDTFVEISNEENFEFPNVSETQQFDEYESLIATCLHYSLRLASTISLPAIFDRSVSNNKVILSSFPANTLRSCELKTPISNHCCVSLRNKLWLIGGTNINGTRLSNITQVQLKIYSDSFEVKEDTVTISGNCDDSLFQRLHAAAVFIEKLNTVFIFGGRKSPKLPCSSDLICIKLNESDDSIDALSILTPEFSTPWPCARWRHTLTSFEDENGVPHLLLFGGKSEKETLPGCWIYNLQTQNWKQFTSNGQFPTPRHSHSAFADGQKDSVFIIGGLNADYHLSQDSFWQYNYKNNTWIRHKELEKYSRKVGSQLLIYKNNLLIVGGVGNDSEFHLDHFVTIISLESNIATSYRLELDQKVIFLMYGISSFLHSIEDNTYLGVLAGGGNCFSFGTYYNDQCLLINLSTL